MRSGTRPDSNSSVQKRFEKAGEVVAGERGADAGIDADKQHANSRLDAIAKRRQQLGHERSGLASMRYAPPMRVIPIVFAVLVTATLSAQSATTRRTRC
jgi:hypothetical protein